MNLIESIQTIRIRNHLLRGLGIFGRSAEDSLPFLDALFLSPPDAIFFLDDAGRIIDYRTNGITTLYNPPETFLGKKIYQALPEEIAYLFDDAIRRTVELDEITALEYVLPSPAGIRSCIAKFVKLSPTQLVVCIQENIDSH
jgi:hypothetical protein